MSQKKDSYEVVAVFQMLADERKVISALKRIPSRADRTRILNAISILYDIETTP